MDRMAREAYKDLAGRDPKKQLVRAISPKDWVSHVTSSNNLSRLTPLTGVKHSVGRKYIGDCNLNARLSFSVPNR
jgi:hypothetical protein